MNDIILMAPLYGFNELKNIVSRRRKMEKKCYQWIRGKLKVLSLGSMPCLFKFA